MHKWYRSIFIEHRYMDKTSVEQEQGNGISVVINTYNASCHLQQVLDTVKGFDEVVVCDMESTDDTLDIAKRNGCKIVVFPRGNYQICEPARQTAIDAASCKWVLVVDADELVVFQTDYIALLFGEKCGNLGQLAWLVRKQDGYGEDSVSLDQAVLHDGGHGDDVHIAAA